MRLMSFSEVARAAAPAVTVAEAFVFSGAKYVPESRVCRSKEYIMTCKKYLPPVFGFVVLLGSFLLSLSNVSHAQDTRKPQPVTVENTVDRPIPVTGSITIPNRVVTCPDERCPASTLNANDRNAFQKRVQFTIPAGTAIAGTNITVPVGKRLVIEFVTVQQTFNLLGEHSRGAFLRTVLNGQEGSFNLLVTKQAAVEGTFTTIWTATQQMRVYADAPEFRIEAGRTPQVIPAEVDVSVSGYLVDL
jgi:hypothetical protein